MDKKLFLTVTLCAGIFLLWQNLYMKPAQVKQGTPSVQQTLLSEKSATSSFKNTQEISNNKTQEITIGSDQFKVVISTAGAVIKEISPETFKNEDQKIKELIGSSEQLQITSSTEEWAKKFGKAVYKVISTQKIENGDERTELVYEEADFSVKRVFTTNTALFSIDVDTFFQFKAPAPNYIFFSTKAKNDISKAFQENERRNIYFNKVGGQESWDVSAMKDLKEDLGEGRWFAITSRYFLNAIIDKGSSSKPQFQGRPLDGGFYAASLIYKTNSQQLHIPNRIYFGPKNIDLLKKVEPNLDAVVDFGWFTIIAYPLLKALKWFYKFVGNYGLAIILLTVLVKIITYPLTLKSMKGMKEMQRIQPQLAALREKHANDKEALNKEMLQLMRANGYNPMSGCLPMFIQMPIFIALYNVLYGAIDLYGQPFFGWIHDLSAKDPFYVTPILLGLMMFLQQKMTPNTSTDPAQQKMMTFMPVIFSVMMLWLPSGLTLYMLVNSIVTIIQQMIINKNLGNLSSTPA